MTGKKQIEVADQSLVDRGVVVLLDFWQTIAIDTLDLQDALAFVTGVDSPYLNGVVDKGSAARNFTAIAAMVSQFFKQYHVPWGWYISSTVDVSALQALKFSLMEEAPGMYCNLADPLQKSASKEIIIKEVDKNSDLLDWIQPIREGFESKDNCETYRNRHAALLKGGDRKLRHFVAYFQGNLAAAATLFLSEDAVMLHNIATRTALRRKGIGEAITLHMMNEAKKLGYEHCYLDSSKDGFHLYHKMGFRVYCLTDIYSMF